MPEQLVSEKTSMTPHPKVEIIPANPSSKIFLNIEEIPPMEIVDIPMHRFVVKRGEKNRKID